MATKKNKKDNTLGLKEHAKLRQQQTFEKVDKAIAKLKRSKTKQINFKTVAEEAGVTPATLYNNLQIKERIMGLREMQKRKAIEEKEAKEDVLYTTPNQQKVQQIKQLRQKVRELEEDKRNLLLQLVEHEELKDEVIRLREHVKKVTPI
ncbi:DUF6262 family protein [Bacillaceae bacterium IKA-2]|nr:DUF6262 family protein [Bacillaceae bacterium IKA-2]